MWSIIYLFTTAIVSAFGIVNDDLNEFTAFAMRVQFITLPIIGFQIVSSNYFQATGQPAKSIFLSLTRQILFLIPLILFLPDLIPHIAPSLHGLDALYFAQPCADLLSTVTTVVFVIWEVRRLRRMEDEQRGCAGDVV